MRKVIEKETCVVARSLICKREGLNELEILMASTTICLNYYDILIGGGKSRSQRQVNYSSLIEQRGLQPF